MAIAEFNRRVEQRSNFTAAGQVVLAVLAVWLIAGQRLEPRKHRCGMPTLASCGWIIAPTTSADVTATPAVTTPTASIAGFSVWPLPVVAAVVDVERLHVVAIARIGSLYGP